MERLIGLKHRRGDPPFVFSLAFQDGGRDQCAQSEFPLKNACSVGYTKLAVKGLNSIFMFDVHCHWFQIVYLIMLVNCHGNMKEM